MDREKKRLKQDWRQQQRAAARAQFPLADDQLQSLFAFIEAQLDEADGDHSRRFTQQWLLSEGMAPEPVLVWLEEHGGYCDCEVVANAQQHWEENRQQEPPKL